MIPGMLLLKKRYQNLMLKKDHTNQSFKDQPIQKSIRSEIEREIERE